MPIAATTHAIAAKIARRLLTTRLCPKPTTPPLQNSSTPFAQMKPFPLTGSPIHPLTGSPAHLQPSLRPIQPQNLSRVTLPKRRILELITQLHLEPAIRNLLVGPPAFALCRFRRSADVPVRNLIC